MALTFPVRPSSALPELAQACIDLVPQLQRKLAVVQGYTIGTSETAIAHGLGVVPLTAIIVRHGAPSLAGPGVWRTRAPDERFVYYAASASTVCDVVVIA